MFGCDETDDGRVMKTVGDSALEYEISDRTAATARKARTFIAPRTKRSWGRDTVEVRKKRETLLEMYVRDVVAGLAVFGERWRMPR